ncbi:MAG TPA: ParB-like protein [Pseudolabrys sp.]|nr:ParB-like protein [Pseudolabrys sp.]
MLIREPLLHPVPIADLRPTQISVGMHEVHEKQKSWRRHGKKKKVEFIERHAIPIILGPKQRPYVIDHHHLARALHEEGVKDVSVVMMADLSRLSFDSFWLMMDGHGWVHPYDEKGKRRHYDDIPHSVDKLKDDPYRSLAGELRRAGGFAKDTTPFSEFLWADLLRQNVRRSLIEKDFTAALDQAMTVAKSSKADYLPGWCGPVT